MPLITMNQKAQHWTRTSHDGIAFTFGDASEIDCRWEKRSVMFLDAQGRERVSRGVVYTTTEVSPGDFLALGEADDVIGDSSSAYDTDDPHAIVGAYEVRAVNDGVRLDGVVDHYKVML